MVGSGQSRAAGGKYMPPHNRQRHGSGGDDEVHAARKAGRGGAQGQHPPRPQDRPRLMEAAWPTSTPQSATPQAAASPQQATPQAGRLQEQHHQQKQPKGAGPVSAADQHDADGQGTGKGVISLLQEFVQCSRQFHAPQHRPILQWSFDNRMADFTTLEFRGTVAFLLDGVPHHVAGAWHPSKKCAQRDAAERALAFFVGKWGEQLLLEQEAGPNRPSPPAPSSEQPVSEARVLEEFCGSYPACAGKAPQWSATWEGGECSVIVEISLLGVPHKFAGNAKPSEEAAADDTARRVLWYLQCPGYENVFTPDPRAPAVVAKEIPAPPASWASSDAAEGCALQMAERKTALMRVQNRLQQAFARQLRPGQSVWEWSYETDEDDLSWPPLWRATVSVPVAGKSFTGAWARGQRDAQIEACGLVSQFLSDGELTRTPSRGSSTDLRTDLCGGETPDGDQAAGTPLSGGGPPSGEAAKEQ